MGEGKVRFILIVCVLGLLSAQSTALGFAQCYRSCLNLCFTTLGYPLAYCDIKCLKDCASPSTPLDTSGEETQQGFCKLGCAVSLCTNISSKSNPGGEKVESCVNSCSGRCANKKHSP